MGDGERTKGFTKMGLYMNSETEAPPLQPLFIYVV